MMAKITEIKKFKVVLKIECNCGTIYKWTPKGNEKCPSCGTQHDLVLAPKSVPKKEG